MGHSVSSSNSMGDAVAAPAGGSGDGSKTLEEAGLPAAWVAFERHCS